MLLGGPGADFLNAGAGNDSLYVDLSDTWVGGLPEDIIIGGPLEIANLFLFIGTD